MSHDDGDNDEDDIDPALRKVLAFIQFLICRNRGFPPDLTPAQHNEIMRLVTAIVFLCGEGHSLDVIQPGITNLEGKKGMQKMRDAIADEIIKTLKELSDYCKAVSATADVTMPASTKSPWKM